MVWEGMMYSAHLAKDILALWTSKALGSVQDGMTHANGKATALVCACARVSGLGS